MKGEGRGEGIGYRKQDGFLCHHVFEDSAYDGGMFHQLESRGHFGTQYVGSKDSRQVGKTHQILGGVFSNLTQKATQICQQCSIELYINKTTVSIFYTVCVCVCVCVFIVLCVCVCVCWGGWEEEP